jgi:site-specific DNA-methyltransferase (adenine-specific)
MNIVHGDCLEVMRGMADNSVDSIVTDPPYGLSFMGKKWDYDVPGEDIWRECLRVLKPGGHLLAFAGTRTQHRMAVRIEDAGFEIRDMIAWVYGSGFPKSHNVGNAVDKSLGCENRGHAISSGSQIHPTTGKPRANGELLPKYEGRTDEGKKWAGFGTALKPAMEPITVARKPLIGTVADNVLTHGTGALNIDGCRVGGNIDEMRGRSGTSEVPGGDTTSYRAHNANGGVWNPNDLGRWPANLIHDGSDEVLECFPNVKTGTTGGGTNVMGGVFGNGKPTTGPVREGSSGSAARFFYCAKASKHDRDEGCECLKAKKMGFSNGAQLHGEGYDKGQDIGLNRVISRKNNHPTVKPTALMRYLCRLVTPPGGTILDPFMGSGSTGKAAALEGFRFIGIELEKEYTAIAEKRIMSAQPLFAGVNT